MRPEIASALVAFAARDTSAPSAWLEGNVVIPHGYPGAAGPFSFGRFPFWREVVDRAAERRRLEVVVWKCSQAGGTECVLQGALRWAMVNRPGPFLWVGAQQEMVELFWEKRILPGLLDGGRKLKEALAGGRSVAMRFSAPNGGSVVAVWSSSRAGVKSNAYAMVFCDEVSTYDSFTLEKIRARTENFAEGKIWIMSALDKRKFGSTRDDPLFKEWALTDKREWLMPDPGKEGGRFRFVMGWNADKGEADSGLKWAQDAREENGNWNLARVGETAHFVTPSGAVVTEGERAKLIDAGGWAASAEGRPGAVGYRVPCFLLRHKSFGDVACGFLRAKKTGPDALRTFILEELAEEWKEARITIGDTILDKRRADYAQGRRPSASLAAGQFPAWVGAPKRVLVSGDVQKLSLYWLAREWIVSKSGRADSGLVDWREVAEWGEFEDLTRGADAAASLVDLRYKWRRGEVLEYAANYPRIIPCAGSDSRMKHILKVSVVDAGEGRFGGGRRANGVGVITFDSWVVSWHLFQLVLARKGYPAWLVPRDSSRTYFAQLMAEEFVDGKMVERHAGADNHLLDCEKMQIVGALYFGLLSPFRSNFTLPDGLGGIDNQKQLALDLG